ncbi:hypothetical protein BHE74_00043797 [Ensete ventricosum]|nr:hypothetical protein GW17_00051125 [Ensete ventricosum]RWW49977.1 hypothetical protein BHE74_00043797 [Ensete ventricosum]
MERTRFLGDGCFISGPPLHDRLGGGFTARRDVDASLGYCSSDRYSGNGLAGETQRFVEWLRQAWSYIRRRAQAEHVHGGNIGGDRG